MIFLLFDYVHLLKNIRNLWLTEKTGELAYEEEGIKFVAKWQNLRDLFKSESRNSVKMSNLTEIGIYTRQIVTESRYTPEDFLSQDSDQARIQELVKGGALLIIFF